MTVTVSIRRNLLANFAGQGITVVMNLAFIPVYIHYLGIEAFGLIGVFTIVLTCAMLLDGGLTPTLNREMARVRAGARSAQSIADLLRSIEWLCAALVASLWIAGFLVAPWLARTWVTTTSIDPAIVAHALFLMVVAASLRVVEGMFRGALLGLERAVTVNLLSSASVTLRAGGAAAVLALASPTLEAFFLWQAATSLVSALVFALVVHRALPPPERRPRASVQPLREVARFAGGVLGTGVLSLLLTQIDKILLVQMIPLAAFGYFALAATLANGLYQLSGPVSQSYYPRLTELFERGDEAALAAAYHRGCQTVAAIVVPTAVLLAVFATPIVALWTGDAEVAAHTGPLLTILAAGTMFHCLMYVPYMLQLAAGWSGLAMRINAVAVVLLVPALLVIVPRYGAMGAAGAWLALNTAYVTISIQFMHRRLLPHEQWRWYRRDILPPILAASGAALILRWLMPANLGPIPTAAYVAAAGIALAAAAWTTSPLVDGWRRRWMRPPFHQERLTEK